MDERGSRGGESTGGTWGTKPVGSIELGEVDGLGEADEGRGTGVDFGGNGSAGICRLWCGGRTLASCTCGELGSARVKSGPVKRTRAVVLGEWG